MANQRTTFGKRRREQAKQDKARAKQERLAARRSEAGNGQKGPPMGEPQIIEPAPMPPLPPVGDVTDSTTTSPTAAPPGPRPGSLLPPIVSRRS